MGSPGPSTRGRQLAAAIAGAALLVGSFACSSGSSGAGSSAASKTSASDRSGASGADAAGSDIGGTTRPGSGADPSSTTTPGPAPSTAPGPSTTVAVPPSPTVTEGDHRVGRDLNPGRYLSRSVDCTWARLQVAGDGSTTVIASGSSSGQTIVDVLTTDGGFTSSRCGTWTPLLSETSPQSSFGAGTWAVGGQIVPGSYQPAAGDSCDWTRLRDFQGGAGSVIETGSAATSTTVVIQPGDVGFSSTGCGTWTKVS